MTIPEFFTINTSLELGCLIVACIALRRDEDKVWRSLIVFLFLTCVTELSAIPVKKHYLEDRVHNYPNIWLYNILLIFQIGFTFGMFYDLLKKYIGKLPLIISGLVPLIILYFDELSNGLFKYCNVTNTVMSILFVIYGFYFYYCLLNDEEYLDLKYSPAFWWVLGTLFFYFGRTTCNLIFGKFPMVKITATHTLVYYVYIVLNILLYSCWSYSFICRKWLTSRSKRLSY